jgi:molecular chaperone HtpG
VITKRFLKFLAEEAKKDEESYLKFWEIFGIYLKEGVASDFEYRSELGKLLRFQSSKSKDAIPIGLDEYLLRISPEQEEIYYINGPSRAAIEAGPYVEMFRKKDIEIIYTTEPIDDFVLSHLAEYEGKKFVSADRADLSLADSDASEDSELAAGQGLDESAGTDLVNWLKEALKGKVADVSKSSRLVDAPAMIVNPDGYMTSSMERVMAAGRMEKGLMGEISKKNLEINTANGLICRLAELIKADEPFAREVALQIYDNAMIQAGLNVDPLEMVERNYRILNKAVE